MAGAKKTSSVLLLLYPSWGALDIPALYIALACPPILCNDPPDEGGRFGLGRKQRIICLSNELLTCQELDMGRTLDVVPLLSLPIAVTFPFEVWCALNVHNTIQIASQRC